MLLAMAAAIRHGTSVIALEHRVKTLRDQHRAELIARGLIEPDPADFGEIEFVEPEEAEAPLESQRHAA